MTWTAVGSLNPNGSLNSSTFSLTPSATGNMMAVVVANFANATVFASALSSSNVTWTAAGHILATSSGQTAALFIGTVTSTGNATVTVTWSGTAPGSILITGQEFHSSVGSWSVDTTAGLDGGGGTAIWPSMTPAASGELYVGYAVDGGTSVAGSTGGYTYIVDSAGCGYAYNLNCAGGVSTHPVWGAGTFSAGGFMALVAESGGGGTGGGVAAWAQPWPAPMTRAFGPSQPWDEPQAFSITVPQTIAGTATAAAVSAAAGSAGRYITGIGGSGASSYFTDNTGSPRPMFGDTPWGLLVSAGRWSSGAWQSDIDTYMANRAGQGYTAIELGLMANTVITGTPTFSGQTWDGIFPFPGGSSPGDPSAGLTSTYWARFDYLLASAAAQGITVFANFGLTYDIGSGGCLSALTNQKLHDYGLNVATRYLGTQNIIWRIEDDYFGSDDSKLDQILAGIRAAGDTRPVSCQNYAESTSRKDISNGTTLTWGSTNSQYQWCYSYNVAYFAVEEAYKESSPILVLRGDGYYYKNSGDDQLIRNHFWWALASGSRGWNGGDDNVWQFGSQTSYTDTANANAGQFHNAVVKNGATFLAGLTNWHLLLPDTSNAFITAGRGTRATSLSSGGGGGAYGGTTDAYVAASLTAAGDLALIYATHHGSFTVDTSKLTGSLSAHWVDPVTCATTPTTPGSSYDSTSLGNNSAGNPDWVLVLQAATSVPGTASAAGAGQATGNVTVIATASASAASGAAGLVAKGATAAAAGSGTAAGLVTQVTIAAAPAAASAAGLVTEVVLAAAAGAGTATGTGTAAGTTTAAAAGSATGLVTQGNTAAGAAAGTATGSASVAGMATAAAASTAAASVTEQSPGEADAASSAAGLVTQAATAAVAAAGTASGLVTGQITGSAAGQGTVSAAGYAAGSAEADAAGSVTALVRQVVTAGADGQGLSLGAASVAGSATAAGTGSITGLVTESTTGEGDGLSSATGAVTERTSIEADAVASVTGLAVQVATASAAVASTATGSATSTSGQHGEADGTSSVAAAVVQGVAGEADGAGAASAVAVQKVTVSAAGAGGATGLVTEEITASAAGVAAAAGLVVQQVTASAASVSTATGSASSATGNTAEADAASSATGLVTQRATAAAAASSAATGAPSPATAATATAAAAGSAAGIFTVTASALAAASSTATGTTRTSAPAAVLSGTATAASMAGSASVVPGPGGTAAVQALEGSASIG